NQRCLNTGLRSWRSALIPFRCVFASEASMQMPPFEAHALDQRTLILAIARLLIIMSMGSE
ncbi:hypothetical protein CIC12_16745, partial [Burkholderia sp. SG-MS1]|uniref:hypothetical protein n=1 Tax=Paraburkholderia sp. SG-MS1 TaxID=2023741 RepID=UPI0016BBBB34